MNDEDRLRLQFEIGNNERKEAERLARLASARSSSKTAAAAAAGTGGAGCILAAFIGLIVLGGAAGGGRNSPQQQSTTNEVYYPPYSGGGYDESPRSQTNPEIPNAFAPPSASPLPAPSYKFSPRYNPTPNYTFPPALSAKDNAIWRRTIKTGECLTEGHKSEFYTFRTDRSYSQIYPNLNFTSGTFNVYSLKDLKQSLAQLNHADLKYVADLLNNMNAKYNASGKPDRLATNMEALASWLHDTRFPTCKNELVWRVVETPFKTGQLSR